MTAITRPGVYVNQQLTPLAATPGISGEGTAAFALTYNTGPTTPVEVANFGQFTNLFGTFANSGGSLLHHAVYQYFAHDPSGSCFVVRVPNTDAVAAHLAVLDTNESPDTVMTVNAQSPGVWGNSIYIEIIASGTAGRFNLNVYQGGTGTANRVESYVSASINPADSRYVGTMINSPVSGSSFITVTVTLPSNTYVEGTNDPAPLTPTALASGSDGTSENTPAGSPLATAISAAYDTLQNQVLNLNLPGSTDTAAINGLLAWADGRGDVEMVIDGPAPDLPETSATVAANYTSMVSGGSSVSADANANIYGPWMLVLDPSSTVPGATRFVPPGGAVLAMWDRAASVYGIQQAPAGTWALLNVVDLEVHFTATDLNNLTAAQVNPLKLVPGTGFCVFGARTLSKGYPNMYTSVQRTLVQLTHDMENILAPFVFAPNDSNLWLEISTALTGYLTQQMQNSVLAGSTPDTAFSVTCDTTNNTSASAQAGVVNATVAVALLSPAEFIIIDLQQLTAAATGS